MAFKLGDQFANLVLDSFRQPQTIRLVFKLRHTAHAHDVSVQPSRDMRTRQLLHVSFEAQSSHELRILLKTVFLMIARRQKNYIVILLKMKFTLQRRRKLLQGRLSL